MLGEWLESSGAEPGEPLPLDGETLRGIHGKETPEVHMVSDYANKVGAALAQTVLGQVALAGRVVTAVALQTQREGFRQIVASVGIRTEIVAGHGGGEFPAAQAVKLCGWEDGMRLAMSGAPALDTEGVHQTRLEQR